MDQGEMNNLFGTAEAESIQKQLMAFVQARSADVLLDQPRLGTA